MRWHEVLAFLVLFFVGPMLALTILAAGSLEWSAEGAAATVAGLVACGWALTVIAQVEPE